MQQKKRKRMKNAEKKFLTTKGNMNISFSLVSYRNSVTMLGHFTEKT